MVFPFSLLSFARKKIDVSTGHAIWSALGTALIATIGVLYFKEPPSLLKIVSLTLVVLGVIGLNLSGIQHQACSSTHMPQIPRTTDPCNIWGVLYYRSA